MKLAFTAALLLVPELLLANAISAQAISPKPFFVMLIALVLSFISFSGRKEKAPLSKSKR